MASKSEVGHAKNVANFQDLLAFVRGYGANYSPSKESLKVPQLEDLHNKAKDSLINVTEKNTVFNNSVNARMATFSELRPLSTRLVNALDASEASDKLVIDAKGFNRKIQGKRASKKLEPIDPDQPAPNTISTSQQSFDQMIEHFHGFISILESEPSYAPNENDLKVVTLKAKLQDLKDKNDQTAEEYTSISNARLDRDKILYEYDVGLVDVAGEVKKYVKSVFGASSAQFGLIKGIKFSKKKIAR